MMSAPVGPPASTEDAPVVGAAPASAVANWAAGVADPLAAADPTGGALREAIRAWIMAIWAVTPARSPVPWVGTELTGAVIGHSPADRRGRQPGRRSRPSRVGQCAARGSARRPGLARGALRPCAGPRRRWRARCGGPAPRPTSGRRFRWQRRALRRPPATPRPRRRTRGLRTWRQPLVATPGGRGRNARGTPPGARPARPRRAAG